MDLYNLFLGTALSSGDCRVTNATLTIFLVCFICLSVYVYNTDNYGTVSHANALDTVAEVVRESGACG